MCGMCSVSKSQSQSNDVCSFNLVFLTPHPSPLTPHPSPLTPHPSPLTPHRTIARKMKPEILVEGLSKYPMQLQEVWPNFCTS